MSSIIIPRKWQTQPQYPVELNLNHWICDGLVSYLPGNLPISQGNTGTKSLIQPAEFYVGGERGLVVYTTTDANSPKAPLASNLVLPLTVATWTRWNGTTGTNMRIGSVLADSSDYYSLHLSITGVPIARHKRLGSWSDSTYGSAATANRWNLIGGVFNSTVSRTVFYNGIAGTENTTSKTEISGAQAVRLGYSEGVSTSALLVGQQFVWSGDKGSRLADVYRELQNEPWQFLVKKKQVLYFDVGGGSTHNLDAAATATATASGALTHSVPLAAAAVSVATATGALSVSIPLAASAAATATATGDLSTTGSADLAATATATTTATGALSLSIPLSGAAVAQALAAAGITQGVPLAGAAATTAAASGALTLSVSLSGSAIAEAAASAGLTVTSASSLAAAAAAAASASGSLTHGVPLSAAALTVSSASGNLTQIVTLSASAASASLATGGLDISVSLSAAALAEALASAGLTVQGGLSGDAAADATASGSVTLRVNLDGAAVANAVASGALSTAGLIVAGTPGWRVSQPYRSWRISA